MASFHKQGPTLAPASLLLLCALISTPTATHAQGGSSWVEITPYACFGAESDKKGTFELHHDIKAQKFRFHHLSGTVQCTSAVTGASFWGCAEPFWLLGLIVTPEDDKTNEIIPWADSPAYTRITQFGHAHWYRIAGLRTPIKEDLVLDVNPDQTMKKGKYHVWYSEDLSGNSVQDNKGTSCFQLSYLPVEGSITTTTATTTTYTDEYSSEFIAGLASDIAQQKQDITEIKKMLTRMTSDRDLDLETVGLIEIRVKNSESRIDGLNESLVEASDGLNDLVETFKQADERNKKSNALLAKIKEALGTGIKSTGFMNRDSTCTSSNCDISVAAVDSGDLEFSSSSTIQMKTKSCGDVDMCTMVNVLTEIATSMQGLDKLD